MDDLKNFNQVYKKKTSIYKRSKNSNTMKGTKKNKNPINKIKIEINNKSSKNINASTSKFCTTPNQTSTPNIKNIKNNFDTKDNITKKTHQNKLGSIYINSSIQKNQSFNNKNKQKNNSSIRNQQNINLDKKSLFTLYVENGQNIVERNEVWYSDANNNNFTNPNEQKPFSKNSNIIEVNKPIKSKVIKNKNKLSLDVSVKNTSKKIINRTNNNKNTPTNRSFFNSEKQRKTKKIIGRSKINFRKKTNLKLKLDYENCMTLNNNIIQNELNTENKQSLKSIHKSSTNLKRNLTSVHLNTQNNHIPHYLENTVSTKNKKAIPIKKETKLKNNSKYKKILLYKKNYSDRNSINIANNYIKTNEEVNIYNKRRGTDHNLDKMQTTKNFEKKPSFNKTFEKKSSLNIKEKSIEKNKNSFMHHTPNLRTEILTISNENNNNINNYIITKELGKGSYATVKLATHKISKIKYAIKIYSRKSLLDPQKRNTINNEIVILKQLDHINIVKLYEVINTPSHLYLVMEYINGVSLLEIIKQEFNHYISQNRSLKIFIQVLKAIIYCQSKDISHRDIKLENILVIQNDIVKIIDFGFAVKATKSEFQKLFCGTPSYMSPEIVNKQKYIAQYSDIWSMGVLLFSMLYGRFPFRAKEQDVLFEKISNAEVVFPDDVEIDERLKLLFKKIFVIVPTQRPSLKEILNEIMIIDK